MKRGGIAGALLVVAATLVPVRGSAQVTVLSPGTRQVGTTIATCVYEYAGCVYPVSEASASTSADGEFDAIRSVSDPDSASLASTHLSSFVGSTGAQGSLGLGAATATFDYQSASSAIGSGFTFRVTTPATATVHGSFSLQTPQLVGFDYASVGLVSGVWNGSSLQPGATLVNEYWSPGNTSNSWSPGDSFERTISLPPGDYQFSWGAQLVQGGNPRFGYENGSGSLALNTALTITPGAAHPGCLQINGPASPVTLGTSLAFDATCCSGSTPSAVPATPANGALALACTLLVAGLVGIQRKRRGAAAALLLVPVLLSARSNATQIACPGSVTWVARSGDEVFTGTGNTFTFVPTMTGVFSVTAISGSETATIFVDVIGGGCASGADCNDGNPCTDDACQPDGQCTHVSSANGTVCGATNLCLAGECLPFALRGLCCSDQLQRSEDLGIAVLGAEPSSPSCASRFTCDWPGGCAGVPASGAPGFLDPNCFRGTRLGDTVTGTNAADVLIGAEGGDTISALQGDDSAYGDTGADQIHGGRGNDCLRGGKDGDDLFGELDNDRLVGDRGDDRLRGGDGDDVYVYDARNVGSAYCSNGVPLDSGDVIPDGDDTITDETSGNDTVVLQNANASDVCLDRGGNDLIVRICQGQVRRGSISASGYFAAVPTNRLENVFVAGN